MKRRHIIPENKVHSVCIKDGNKVEIGTPISWQDCPILTLSVYIYTATLCSLAVLHPVETPLCCTALNLCIILVYDYTSDVKRCLSSYLKCMTSEKIRMTGNFNKTEAAVSGTPPVGIFCTLHHPPPLFSCWFNVCVDKYTSILIF